ncbi:hypothetical protein [Dysgonomonas sp. 520]|uniref:hypothetical protein n=1 Tax=Dysgonomonas sp. 520 TaxID=2302931 RepID=UPI0013D7C8EC|nr:hypothetical protein [Dysgonomonas sp. 520]NDW10622.1 hypothetical protein [Dysgonomonas sp. 520]
MKYFVHTFLFVFSILFLSSCGEEDTQRSTAKVRFKLDLIGLDNNLSAPYSYSIFNKPRNKEEYLGYSGLIIFNNDNALGDGKLKAYDQMCPHENQANIKITPTEDFKAVCTKCNSMFDLIYNGIKLSGPSKYSLYRYSIYGSGTNLTVGN